MVIATYVLGMITYWWYSKYDVTGVYKVRKADIDYLADHCGTTTELVLWDMVEDVIDIWIDAHTGVDEGCDVY